MRCIALAERAVQSGMRAVLATVNLPAAIAPRAKAAGLEVVPIPTAHPDPGDITATARAVHREPEPRWAVIDGYAFDDTYVQALRSGGCRVLFIDDLQSLPAYSGDVVLNQNAGAECRSYPLAHGRSLLGPRYALLRRDVLEARREIVAHEDKVRRVVVTMGGSDPSNATESVIDVLRRADLDAEIAIVIGPANPETERIIAAARDLRDARVLIDPPDFPRLLAGCDLAISAGGTTALELAYLGVPAALVITAENQRSGAETLADAGAARLISFARTDSSQAAAELVSVADDAGARERMARTGRLLVDGRGSHRVVQWLEWDGISRRPLVLRPIVADDSVALWQIANDPEVRANSFRSEPIPLVSHLPWFASRVASPDTRMFVLAWGDEVAAQIRYDRSPTGLAEIGFSVASGFRGEGLGTRILADTWSRACHELGVDGARGVVFESNEASRRAFLSAGFGEVERTVVESRPCVIFERRMSVAA